MRKDYYVIFGIASDATLEEVKSAFRRRAMELHPDTSGLASRPFLEAQEAYGVVSEFGSENLYPTVLFRVSVD